MPEPNTAAVVSFDDEPLILVDPDDNVVGHELKETCHQGEGLLHRAFSVFLFNRRGQLMLQQRSSQKPLWPLYWSNSCCSHPRRGENEREAAERRVSEELGVAPELVYLYKFRYQARYGDVGAEHELCSVFVGRCDQDIEVNANEIADWAFVDVAELERDLANDPDRYTPWLKLEWPRIRKEFWSEVQRLVAT